jgi:class 3 adenylate cyclase
MLLFAALLILGMAGLVAASGEERQVRLWFGLLCVACATVCVGLFVETRFEPWALLAARVNMTAAFAATTCGLVSAAVMCRMPVVPVARVVIALAALANLVTIWLSDLYFSGQLYRYPWGIYVGGNPLFVLSPILSALPAGFGLALLLQNFRTAHPLDRNRAKYLFVAYLFLASSLLDYLPHFGLDLFGGTVSALTMPAFVVIFGYACLRYRLISFRELLACVTGWVLTSVVLASAYALVIELDRRFVHGDATTTHVAAAVLCLVLLALLGPRLPRWLSATLGAGEDQTPVLVERASSEIMTLLDEEQLRARVLSLCGAIFGASSAAMLRPAELQQDAVLSTIAPGDLVLECERLRRQRGSSPLLDAYELVAPLWQEARPLGALALGRRSDDKMYLSSSLTAFRTLANIYTIALLGARRAHELARRQRLDRYLPPQVVERMLTGHRDAIEDKRRITLTIFFSDLKDFTQTTERLDPDKLSTVLNEYLSEMADLAFQHGGTLDKFIGDAVMVLFGAPVETTPEQAATRCVEMAVAMQQRLRVLNQRWRERQLLEEDLQARMGIHTGEATVGSFGSQNRLEYTAIGQAVNLASRLEGKDTPGTVLVSADTYALVRDRFVGKSRGEVAVKGFAKPVEVFEIDPLAPPRVAAPLAVEEVSNRTTSVTRK